MSKNIREITFNIKNFKRIQNNPKEINLTLNFLTKLIWILTYSSMKHSDVLNINSISELTKDSITIFNKFISEINENVLCNHENHLDDDLYISKENLNILLLSYIYLNNQQNISFPKLSNNENSSIINNAKKDIERFKTSKKFIKNNDQKSNKNEKPSTSINNNINIEFLKSLNVIDYDLINFINYNKYIIFAKLIEFNLKNRLKIIEPNENLITKNFQKFHLDYNQANPNNKEKEEFNFFKEKYYGVKVIDSEIIHLLDPTFFNKIIINQSIRDQIVFINQPYDYFKISDSVSGKIKIRREICKILKINYIEYDIYEFLNFSNLQEGDFDLNSDNFEEYSERIDEYITAKNEVFTK